MRNLVVILITVILGGCVAVSETRYRYYDDGYGGGYYYEREPVRSSVAIGVGWYDPYDSLFWGLRYSYFDPFWFPGFYYGVTYFPRYYHYPYGGWGSWYAGWYRPWRYAHPYSPYRGSYWDHYYAGYWWHHQRPRDHYGRTGRAASVHPGPQRFGSARNAAERLASQRRMTDGRGHAVAPHSGRVMTREGWREQRPAGVVGGRGDGVVRQPVQGGRASGMPSRAGATRGGESRVPPMRSPAPRSRSGGMAPPRAPVTRPSVPPSRSSGAGNRGGRGGMPLSDRSPGGWEMPAPRPAMPRTIPPPSGHSRAPARAPTGAASARSATVSRVSPAPAPATRSPAGRDSAAGAGRPAAPARMSSGDRGRSGRSGR